MFLEGNYIVIRQLPPGIKHLSPDKVYKINYTNECFNVKRDDMGYFDHYPTLRYGISTEIWDWRYAYATEIELYKKKGGPAHVNAITSSAPQPFNIGDHVLIKEHISKPDHWDANMMTKLCGKWFTIKSTTDSSTWGTQYWLDIGGSQPYFVLASDIAAKAKQDLTVNTDLSEIKLTAGMIVQLKNERGVNWNIKGDMDHYKGRAVKIKKVFEAGIFIVEGPESEQRWHFSKRDIDCILPPDHPYYSVPGHQTNKPFLYPNIFVRLKRTPASHWTANMNLYAGAIVKITRTGPADHFQTLSTGNNWFTPSDVEEIVVDHEQGWVKLGSPLPTPAELAYATSDTETVDKHRVDVSFGRLIGPVTENLPKLAKKKEHILSADNYIPAVVLIKTKTSKTKLI